MSYSEFPEAYNNAVICANDILCKLGDRPNPLAKSCLPGVVWIRDLRVLGFCLSIY